MLGLGQTTANLARQRRLWEKLLESSAVPRGPAVADDAGSSSLAEVTGFGSNPGNLRMLVYVPELAPAAPLVVVLHGCTQTAAGYDLGAGWSVLAERYGFALLMPEQKRENNPQGCFNWFQPGDVTRGQGEALSIRQMVARMVAEHGLDARRVFVTGLSAGGAMAAVMLATYPDVFAGGAVLAGLPYGSAHNVQEALDAMFQGRGRPAREWGDLVRAASPHRGPWPKLSVWHGSADATVVPANAEELVKQWTDVHGLPLAPSAEDEVDGYPRRVWRDRSGETRVEAYTITDMAHGTPIAPGRGEVPHGAAAPFMLDVGIASSYRIAQFWGLTEGAAAQADRYQPREPAAAGGVAAGRVGRISAAAPADAREDSAPEKASRPRPGSFGVSLDPEAVIVKALGAAGLLKGVGARLFGRREDRQ